MKKTTKKHIPRDEDSDGNAFGSNQNADSDGDLNYLSVRDPLIKGKKGSSKNLGKIKSKDNGRSDMASSQI